MALNPTPGIALAMVCAAKGYPFVAIMADSFSVERRKIMKFLGAKVILTPAAQRGSGTFIPQSLTPTNSKRNGR